MSVQQVALVTGAASGIGRACARELVARGWRVFGTTRRAEAETGEHFQWVPMDVDRDDSVLQSVTACGGAGLTLKTGMACAQSGSAVSAEPKHSGFRL